MLIASLIVTLLGTLLAGASIGSDKSLEKEATIDYLKLAASLIVTGIIVLSGKLILG